MGDGHDEPWTEAELELYGMRSALTGGILFCGVTEEHFAIGGVTYKWPAGAKLTWALGFSRLGDLDDLTLKGEYTKAFKEISDCCNISHEYTPNPRLANILVNVTRLDGPSGVLADMQIPVGNARADTTQLLGRMDDAEAWGVFENPPANKIDFYRVALHELLHAHGLGHKPNNINEPALIAPMYSRTIRHLQAADKAELVRRYGPAKVDPVGPAPTPVPVPAGDKLIVEELRVAVGGKRYKLSGSVGALPLILDE